MTTFITALLSFILLVFPLVIIHEFGHFLVGKALGAKPTEFSIGFGKTLYQFKWLGALFKISALPLGGYVRFKTVQFDGENGADEVNEKISAWKWILIALAGPVANLIFTFVTFTLLAFGAVSTIESRLITAASNPAFVGQKMLTAQHSRTQDMMSKMLTGEKGFQKIIITDEKAVGVTPDLEKTLTLAPATPVPLQMRVSKSLLLGGSFLQAMFVGTTQALGRLVTSPKGYKELMGPVGIATEANRAKDDGVLTFILLMASLSFALAYFNLLPLSFLDGGRALLALFETVVRRPVNIQTLGRLNQIGFVIFLGLACVGLFSDAMRLLGH